VKTEKLLSYWEESRSEFGGSGPVGDFRGEFCSDRARGTMEGMSNGIPSPGTETTGIVKNDGSCIPLRKLGSFEIPAIITGNLLSTCFRCAIYFDFIAHVLYPSDVSPYVVVMDPICFFAH